MGLFDRFMGRVHRKASQADKKGQSEKRGSEKEKEELERRVKRMEATVRSYGIDFPNKESA